MKNKLILSFLLLSLSPLNAFAFLNGMGVNPYKYGGTAIQYVELLKKYHINSIRLDYMWADVEKEKGVFTPIKKIDDILRIANENGIKPIIILDYGNPVYHIERPKNKADIEKFDTYVNWVYEHFKGYDVIYEVWNEWSLKKPRAKSESLESAYEYVSLVKSVSHLLKSKNSDIKIIAGSFCPTLESQLIWAKKIIDLGVLNYIDGLSVHPYNHWLKPFPTAKSSIESLMSEISSISNGEPINIYITEYGIPDSPFNVIPKDKIGAYALNYYRSARSIASIKGVWWYDFINDGDNPKNQEYNFGLLDSNLNEKSVGYYFRNNIFQK